jgi:DNA-directed RNA polymerase specialized sigma24 family protein
VSADPTSSANGQAVAAGAAFPTTQWSLVLGACSAVEGEARSALESLCRLYWFPIYGFVRRQGRPHHEAEDATQQFFALLLATAGVETARRERGRFRTFLLTALRNFLTDEWRRAQSTRRGGGQTVVSIELARAEERFAEEPADQNLTPDQAFDRAWAAAVLERAISRLREEYESSGRGALFAVLAPRLWDARRAGSEAPAPELPGKNAHALSMALTRLRHRLGLRLREEVASTVANGTDIDEELRQLIDALTGGELAQGPLHERRSL